MKIVVIGGTGLIGSRVMTKLREHGHEAVSASPDSGVNTLTGAGLAEVLKGASVVVDVSNSPQWDDAAVMTSLKRPRAILSSTAASTESSISSPYLSSERTSSRPAATSAPKSLKKN